MDISSLLGGSVSVSTDIISQFGLAQILLVTTQRDLLVLLTTEIKLLLIYVELGLTRFLGYRPLFGAQVDHILLRFVNIVGIALGFIILRLLVGIATELFETSLLRWYEGVMVVLLVFSMVFLMLERNKPLPQPTKSPMIAAS